MQFLPRLLTFACLLPALPLLAGAPPVLNASGLVLTLQASGGSGGADITAFVDEVEILEAATGKPVAGVVNNAGFEFPARNGHTYGPNGAIWQFTASAGIASNGSEFGSPKAPEGNQVAFLQSVKSAHGSLQQLLPPLPAGMYQVRLRIAQRACCYGTFDQGVRIVVDGALLGIIVPDQDGQFHTYTSSSFVVAPPRYGPGGPRRR